MKKGDEVLINWLLASKCELQSTTGRRSSRLATNYCGRVSQVSDLSRLAGGLAKTESAVVVAIAPRFVQRPIWLIVPGPDDDADLAIGLSWSRSRTSSLEGLVFARYLPGVHVPYVAGVIFLSSRGQRHASS